MQARSFRVEVDRACGLRLAFDPVGAGVAGSMIGQIEVTFLERKVYSDRIVWCSPAKTKK